ncbi:MAG: hypothetical protein K6T63_01210 [Alicyclobacillus herbarius]|uniref:hypothetical protein n=1 Tax=Alicyclobacillus herbarius TaxID=122960 RepID=UPI002356E58F|nr:hypothetical protein [Alicyclobacillus herbarius]MCL6631225.1 hypothetical protein [Alicyclobacillus herbarius]
MRPTLHLRLVVQLTCVLFVTFVGARLGLEPVPEAAAAVLRVHDESAFFIPDHTSHRLNVVMQLQMENPNTQAQTVSVPLPKGARVIRTDAALYSQHGSRLSVVDGAEPGHSTLTLTFWLPFPRAGSVVLNLRQFYPVDTIHLYLPIGDTALSASELSTATDTVSIKGTSYRVFTHAGLPANQGLPVSIQELPAASGKSSNLGLPVIGRTAGSTANSLEALGNLALATVIFLFGLLGEIRAKG